MRRRYDRDYDYTCPRTRPNWFMLFFIMVAIFFFNYFGKKLSESTSKIAYNFSFIRLGENMPLSLQDFRGNYLIIAFVITNCEPCVWQIKELERLKTYSWLKILVVFLDPDARSVEEYVRREEIEMPVYTILPSELNRVVSRYGIEKVPFIVITDKSLRIKRIYDEPVSSSELKDVVKVIKRYGI